MTFTTNDLVVRLPKLSAKDKDFANSLISADKRWGLSWKQRDWVQKLCERADAPKREAVRIGDLCLAIALFDRAAQHLKRPKVVLACGERTIRLSVAGPTAKVPGSINVAQVAPFGEGQWYGRITRDGEFHPARAASDLPNLAETLVEFAERPAQVAARYGHLTGSCCFCNRKLDDERSTSVGYGPVCAKHFGLPWGANEGVRVISEADNSDADWENLAATI